MYARAWIQKLMSDGVYSAILYDLDAASASERGSPVLAIVTSWTSASAPRMSIPFRQDDLVLAVKPKMKH